MGLTNTADLRFLPSPEDRVPITAVRFVCGVLPVYICYYATAVLVLLPGTRIYRMALLPLGWFLAFKTVTTYDFSAGDPSQTFQNFGQCLSMVTIAMRLTWWSFLKEPLERMQKAGSPFQDALDLTINFRGIGWTWSRNGYLPPETRPTASKTAFLLATLKRFIKSIVIYDALTYIVREFAPPGVGTPSGGTIFVHTLPPITRYAYSTLITAVYGGVFYFALEMAFYSASLLAFMVPGLNQQPADWPTFSQAPWFATSLADFWGRRWHQANRHMFVALSTPLTYLFGRVGTVAGAFFFSAILHDWGMWGMGAGTNFRQTGGFFMLMGLGVLIEGLWRNTTGRKVGGIIGWMWTAAWLLTCGNILVDGWMKTGLGGGETLPPFAQPVQLTIKHVLPNHIRTTHVQP